MTPKQKLQSLPEFKSYTALLSDPRLEFATEVAMLTFVDSTPRAGDAQTAMAMHHELEGAKRYLRTLRGLVSVVPERKPDTTGQLNHQT